MDSLTGSGLQSGFVLAVIIGAVLLAGYLGGTQGLVQRAAQVALGLALVLLVFSATAFYTVDEDSDAWIQRMSAVSTIHVGLGIIFVALGVAVIRGLAVLTPAMLMAGVLLLLFGASPYSLDLVSVLDWGLFDLDPGAGLKAARFVVLLVGVLLLTRLLCSSRDVAPLEGGAEAPGGEDPAAHGDSD